MFPDHVGHPIGETGEDEYFMLEIHYNNPLETIGLQFPTGLEIYHTEKLRYVMCAKPSYLVKSSNAAFTYNFC